MIEDSVMVLNSENVCEMSLCIWIVLKYVHFGVKHFKGVLGVPKICLE